MAVSTGNRLRITFHLKDCYFADELKSIGFGNIQKPYNIMKLLITQNGLHVLLR
jgi:hypothetical protein